jgi:arginase
VIDSKPNDGARVVLLGLPTDINSSHTRGAAAGPEHIRRALGSGASNLTSESGVDLGAPGLWRDAGDVALREDAEDRGLIEGAIREQARAGARVLAFGGDHSVTYPVLRGLAPETPPFSILHFDAHPDLYDEFEGNRYSHACPFARIMEEGLARRLVQVGIRTLNAHQAQQAKRFGVEIVTMVDFDPARVPIPDGPLYITFDLDGLDPSVAPGVAHREPGGLTFREALSILRRAPGPVIGADIVELIPSLDPSGMTATVAAKLAKELAALLLRA